MSAPALLRFIFAAFPAFCLPLFSAAHAGGDASAPADTLPLKSAAPHGLGPLTLPMLGFDLLGAVDVDGSGHADLFLGHRTSRGGVWLCKWLETSPDGAPVFAPPAPVKSPLRERGAVFRVADGGIHALWVAKGDLVHTAFDRKRMAFVERDRLPLAGFRLPKTPQSIGVRPNADGSLDLVFEIADDTKGRSGDNRAADWNPYGPDGVWTGGFSYRHLWSARLPGLLEPPASPARQASATQREVYFTMRSLTPVNLGPGHARGFMSGSRQGNLYYFPPASSAPDAPANAAPVFAPSLPAAGPDGVALRHPSIQPGVIAYPNPDTKCDGLLAAGEGGIWHYEFAGHFTDDGAPVFARPAPVLQRDADLFAGALPTPTVIDWDGDGVLDIVAGNSEGFVLFFKNTGADAAPAFLPGERLRAGGRDIHVQAGYSGSVQGVQEARWGYLGPNVVDWNADGLPDIVMGDITGDITVYINRGTRDAPALEAARPLYCDGLDLHGMWRVRPAVARAGSRTALIMVDGDDHFHLYWRIDDYNVADGGKLTLADGSLISASSGPAGSTGRCKLDLFDWDGDGALDLVIGTCRTNAIPNNKTGFPQPALGERPPATVLFMRNVGGNTAPVFAHAVPFRHTVTGKLIQPGGAHESGAVGTLLGSTDGRPNLLACDEAGRMYLYRGANLEPAPPAPAAPPPPPPRTAWFDEARFGLFVHWGVYSVHANNWDGKNRADLGHDSTWLFQRIPIPAADYKKLAAGFTAAGYDPRRWARLAGAAGMRYIVLTSKHHEGFALWPTAAPAWNVMDSPARRDLIGPLAAAARSEGLHFGLYYSQSQDWMNPGGGKRNPKRSLPGAKRDLDDGDGWSEEHKGDYDAYLQKVALPQVNELLRRYAPDILWWDTPIRMTPERAQPFLDLAARYPRMLMNDRLGGDRGGALSGDFSTPEQYVPPEGLPGKRFEVCMTMNDSWGFASDNDNWKSAATLLRILSDTASKGGNLLLNIGPKPDGTIPQPSIDRLREIGAWMRVNAQAIHGTQASPYPRQLPWGRVTRRPLPDGGEALYLHIWEWPADGRLLLPALHQRPRAASLLAPGAGGVSAQAAPEGLVVHLPPGPAPDPRITVLALAFAGPVSVEMDAFLSPDKQGMFTLAPLDADRHGSTAGVMQIHGAGADAFIADWFESRWFLAYRIKTPAQQTCRVTAEITSAAPVSLRIEAGKKRVTSEIPATGGADNWRVVELGVIELPAGETALRLRPVSGKWAPINLRTVTVAPVNQ
ncbi:alpha-L-fucosidase [Termitidicoccus mucosus]|uniref:alpha-L-fucosidase n=1 Tax=Termitidicoccus mucosus TaxID=1184151 RepID=A0A178IK94_9BACT|nr:hypothetical protein AW736_00770 [Opitutaceae bacterium TSB47]